MTRPVLNQVFLTPEGVQYMPISKHRGKPTKDRSVWTRTVAEEVECFRLALNNDWGHAAELWGHRRSLDRLDQLGRNWCNESLWFGKFIRSQSNSPWHGYPADYRRRPQDRPPTAVLVRWRDLGAIEKYQVARVAGGQQCGL